MKRWWMSFWFAGDDWRPLTYPPGPAVLGWWKSGEDSSGRASLVLWVQANTEKDAKRALLADWPESASAEWRFCDEVALDYVPSDRFVLADWTRERMAKTSEKM